MKKFFSILLSVVLVLCIAVPAFATEAPAASAADALESALGRLVAFYGSSEADIGVWDAMGLLALGAEVDVDFPAAEDVLGTASPGAYAKAIFLAGAMGKNPRTVYGAGYEKDLVRGLALMQNDDGSFGSYITETIFAIIALENTDAAAYDRSAAAAALLKAQVKDGGFSGWSDEGDVDTTGMALVAFSYFEDAEGETEIADAVAASVAFLRGAVNENGAYPSAWAEDSEPSESISSAVSGLAAVGADFEGDEVFAALAENLLNYQLENGGFASEKTDTEAGAFATYQAFFALHDLVNGESVYGAFSYDAAGASAMFADGGDLSDGAAAAAALLYNKGIIVGMPGALLAPEEELTVAQLAVVVDKALNPGATYEGVWYASAISRLTAAGILDESAEPGAAVTFELLASAFGLEAAKEGSVTRGAAFEACASFILASAGQTK